MNQLEKQTPERAGRKEKEKNHLTVEKQNRELCSILLASL